MSTIREQLDAATRRIAELEGALKSAEERLSMIGVACSVSNQYGIPVGEADDWARDEAQKIRAALAAAPESTPAKEAEKD